jgi:hypothetical protein
MNSQNVKMCMPAPEFLPMHGTTIAVKFKFVETNQIFVTGIYFLYHIFQYK